MSDLYRLKPCTDNDVLYVISVVSNPARYQRRYQLFTEFCERMRATPTIELLTVEIQQRARPFVTDANLKFRVKDELWYKENMINVAVQHLPHNWQYMAWIDSDILFVNENWARETIEQLQTYDIVQLFTHAIDLGPKGEHLQKHFGFGYQYSIGKEHDGKYSPFFHPGYAWACRRSIYNALGGIMEFPILGSADHHMALCFIEKGYISLNENLNPNYKTLVNNFERRCKAHLRKNIGYVDGIILHYWHGKKKQRFYKERWKILVEHDFDPLYDIKKDDRNLWQLETNKTGLRDDLRKYFRARNEDSIDLE